MRRRAKVVIAKTSAGMQSATRKVEEVAKQGIDAGTAAIESAAGKAESLMLEPRPATNEGDVK